MMKAMRIEHHFFDPHHRGLVTLTMSRWPQIIKELCSDIFVIFRPNIVEVLGSAPGISKSRRRHLRKNRAVPPQDRSRAFRKIIQLVKPGGWLVMTFRQPPQPPADPRGMYPTLLGTRARSYFHRRQVRYTR
jgi:hypothetical protein